MYNNLTPNQKTRLKMLISLLPFTTLFLLTLSILKHPQLFSFTHTTPTFHIHINLLQTQTAELHCEGVLYHDECIETLTNHIPDLHTKTLPEILSATVNIAVTELRDAEINVTAIRKKLKHLTLLESRALEDCFTLFEQTVTELKLAAVEIIKSPTRNNQNLQTLFSAAMTNQDTCLDGFAFSKYKERVRKYFKHALRKISRQVSNSLSILKKINKKKKKSKHHGREVFEEYGTMSATGYPTWLKKKDRVLLQAPVNATKIDLVVAKDGSGNFTTIGEALAAAPNKSDTRFVIYIKSGAYYEYLEVVNKQKNLMFLGDGIEKTLIKGNRSVIDGWTTFRSSTVAVVGSGFIAKGITFENYAGPEKHQAVALRSGSDFSAFYQCSFVGYQDTLYVHSLRQFYRECDIYGTVDFIFGNAAVVFQNSNLYARKPLDNQKNIFTAQGREDPNQNTGISILNCKVAAGSELLPNITLFKSYLGRPWKNYSRTVVMKSKIEEVIDPRGWLEWDGNQSLSTLYYGEYMNRGPGSNTSGRVTWPGYRVINSSTEALQFTVEPFIQGAEFLNNTGIPFFLGLAS